MFLLPAFFGWLKAMFLALSLQQGILTFSVAIHQSSLGWRDAQRYLLLSHLWTLTFAAVTTERTFACITFFRLSRRERERERDDLEQACRWQNGSMCLNVCACRPYSLLCKQLVKEEEEGEEEEQLARSAEGVLSCLRSLPCSLSQSCQ